MLGAAVTEYWIDWGEGAPLNALVRQFPTAPQQRRGGIYEHPARKGEGNPLDSTQRMEQMFRPIRRPISPIHGTHVDLLRGGATDEPWFVHLSRFRYSDGLTNWTPTSPRSLVESLVLDWPPDAYLVGRLGGGGTLVWDRPPGTLDVDIFTNGYLSPTSLNMTLEPGKTYHIDFEYTLSGRQFSVREAP